MDLVAQRRDRRARQPRRRGRRSARALNVEAQVAIEWTRGELGAAAAAVSRRPAADARGRRPALRPRRREQPASMALRDRAREAAAQHAWRRAAARHLLRPRPPAGALHHVGDGKMTAFTPVAGVADPAAARRRWLAVLGSVGQPRDGNPAACLRDARHATARADLLPRALRHRTGRGRRSAPTACRPGSPSGSSWGR